MKKIFTLAIATALLLQSSTPSQAATFPWLSGSSTAANGDSIIITLKLDTQGQPTYGSDAVLNFDTSALDLQAVTFSGSPFPNNFHNVNGNTVKLSSTFSGVGQTYSGSTDYAQLKFKTKKVGSTQISFVCSAGATNDTNIIQAGTGEDIVNCGSLSNYPITVTAANTNTNTNTNTGGTSTGGTGNATGLAGSCPSLASPANLSATAQSKDKILLKWSKTSGADYYAIMFGLEPGKYIYGAHNIGNTDQFTINYLKPNTNYYFAVFAAAGCGTSYEAYTSAKTQGGTASTAAVTTQTIAVAPTTPSYDTLATTSYKPTNVSDLIAKSDETTDPTPTPSPSGYQTPEPGLADDFFTKFRYPLIAIVLLLGGLLFWLFMKKRGNDDDGMDNQLNPPSGPLNQPPSYNPPPNYPEPTNNPTVNTSPINEYQLPPTPPVVQPPAPTQQPPTNNPYTPQNFQ